MKFTDYKQLDKVEFLYPELMAENAEDRIRKMFEQRVMLEDLLADTCKSADDIRKRIAEIDKEWELISPLVRVTYKTFEKEEVKGEINLGFNFGTDVNKHIH